MNQEVRTTNQEHMKAGNQINIKECSRLEAPIIFQIAKLILQFCFFLSSTQGLQNSGKFVNRADHYL